ncbi:DUF2007 domain-containing protein [Aquimarina sp. U1-2]|uniref:putative signal transducing protein n=1 Tax=Aquimarina sp. U1-2 TaxID=2823141 RepID=UPI001AEC9442|nr:DUF2007 domain-containing protein [Aquimarina sp. U1-2]MBP2831349.1 DUF2007 domain-containing protein [Aquimarina sp. U1-2]
MSEMFKTIASFQYSAEALIVKGRLESEGIEVFMTDMHTIDTDPLVSNAIGGIKIKVRSSDVTEAKAILDDIQKYSLNDEGTQMLCTVCRSHKVVFITTITDIKSFFAFLLGFLFGSLPFYTKYTYRCECCKTKFNLK